MGPVGFSAEKKVTTYKGPSGPDTGVGDQHDSAGSADSVVRPNLGQASGPTREFPTKSKELKVVGRWVWYLVAAAVIGLGVIFVEPFVIVLGLFGAVAVFLAGRTHRTEARLRSEVFESKDS
jgi:hypothetical protein